jgi:hypothetical protein
MPYASPNLTFNVTLDMECERATPIIRMGQGTTNARIKVELVSGNAAATIDTSVTFTCILWLQKPDGEIKTYTGKFVTEDNKKYAVFALDNEATDVQGRGYAKVDIRNNSDNPDPVLEYTGLINTQIFYIDFEGFPEKKNYNGIKIVQISKEHFDDLPSKDPNTLYLVHDGDVVYLYLGDTQVGGSGGYNEVQNDVYIDNVTEG